MGSSFVRWLYYLAVIEVEHDPLYLPIWDALNDDPPCRWDAMEIFVADVSKILKKCNEIPAVTKAAYGKCEPRCFPLHRI